MVLPEYFSRYQQYDVCLSRKLFLYIKLFVGRTRTGVKPGVLTVQVTGVRRLVTSG